MGNATFLLIVALTALATTGCSGEDEPIGAGGTGGGSGYAPHIDPADFTTTIDNPFMPWKPGMKLTYVEDETETVVITVTSDTRKVMGVDCVVVHDVHSSESGVIEDTTDWYAQDEDKNVWYFGEDTTEFKEDGGTSKAGSWEGGVNGALPGIAMPGDPKVGTEPYRQEYYVGEAEDMGQVIGVGEDVTVPAGSYTGCVRTKDWSPLTPKQIENKWFCDGIGQVKAEIVEGGSGVEELTEAVIP